MGQESLFILPLVIAIAIGWCLGRRQPFSALNGTDSRGSNAPHPEYFRGLDHLLNQRTDLAVDSFIRALEINSDTIPAHLALARMLRQQGEVERALRVHQTLLARPGLPYNDFLQIQLALARDYDAIGLLDRAENLLQEILREKPVELVRAEALNLLVKLYEKEGEWAQALEQGRKLARLSEDALEPVLAHYCCEMAETALARQRPQEAERHLVEALRLDPNSVRASLLQARMLMEAAHWSAAIKALQQVQQQDARYVSETLAPLAKCFQQWGRLELYESYLDQCMVRSPSTSVLLARAEQIQARQGAAVAVRFVIDELKQRPSTRGINQLIDLYLAQVGAEASNPLRELRRLLAQLEQNKPKYLCAQCGYTARVLHWHCPSCRDWGRLRPILGLEGE